MARELFIKLNHTRWLVNYYLTTLDCKKQVDAIITINNTVIHIQYRQNLIYLQLGNILSVGRWTHFI